MASPYALTVPGSGIISVGPMRAAPLAHVMLEEDERREAEMQQASVPVSQIGQYIRKRWCEARDNKRNTVETRMLKSMRARRGEYDPDKLAAIAQMGGSDVYANLTSVKCRAAASWLRDVLMANGSEKPWSIMPSPVPDLPKKVMSAIVDKVVEPVAAAEASGNPLPETAILRMMGVYRDMALNQIKEQAKLQAQRMEQKMEDQMQQGNFPDALAEFIEDIVTFPSAIMKGPVVRNRPQMEWYETRDGDRKVRVKHKHQLEWERVSPFDIYPSPESDGINDGYLIEKHRLSRSDLIAMLGVDGYNDAAIKLVLEQYGRGGLREWLWDDIGQADAEGKSSTEIIHNPDHLIDAIQFWGTIQGSMLRQWGMSEEEVPNELTEYSVEAWLIGNMVIKATRNSHPLGHKPYYKASYEEIPGSFWGNSPTDLVRDAQTVVNAACRSLVNNMALASGPQVVVNVERLSPGEEIETLRPWRIWQVTNDAVAGGAQNRPVEFHQPDARIAELSGIIREWNDLADTWSGIPRYLSGDNPGGGAGRTASGLSMMLQNAGKSLKQVVSNIDYGVLKPMVERLYFWNMMYGEDEDLKGDVQIVVRGANQLLARDAAELRLNEFLQLTANPIDQAIIGNEGRAEILREMAKRLEINPDKIIPPPEILKQRVMQEQEMQARQEALNAQGQEQAKAQVGGGQTLEDGTPVTDNFSQRS